MPEDSSVNPSREGGSPVAVGALLGQILENRWLTFNRQLLRARRRATESAVHDVRVATRRLIAVLDLLTLVLPEDQTAALRRPARKLLKALNTLRDLQVQRIAVRSMQRQLALLRRFALHLGAAERRTLREATAVFAAFPLGRVEPAVVELEETIRSTFSRTAVRSAGFLLLQGAAAAAFARAVERRRAVRFDSAASIHRFRVAFKKYRYTIELLAPLFVWVDRDMHKAMDRYQTRMGEIQDLDVLARDLRLFTRSNRVKTRIPAQSLLPVYRLLARRREELLLEFEQNADGIYSFWNEAVESGMVPE